MDKLNCMRAFVYVIEAESFTQAAIKMQISKALISKYVGALETSLGIRLLNRTTRRMSVTDSGKAYYERCLNVLQEIDEIEAALRSEHNQPEGILRINAPISFSELTLMPIITEFAQSYPDVTIKLDLADRFIDLVEEGVDLAIRVGDLPDSSLVVRKLTEIRMILCASPAYLAKTNIPVSLESLPLHRCICDSNYKHNNRWVLGRGQQSVSVPISSQININSARAVRQLVLNGQGISLLPSFAVQKDLEEGRLIQLLEKHEPESTGLYALYPHRKHLSAKVRLFIDALINAFGGTGY
ncbi:LysR family transcriptional regulator [Neptunomonas sp.]|uniref:LysR family transcriptional regulator n=1 Tax=Neptunomonas sp. TaxID=1971898 RepID=UPI0025E69276|nr:LysR family transcriptional regulator [Neptunomonas sp.]